MKITSILVICLLACALMVSGCTGTEPVNESPVMQEYNLHVETFEDDVSEMEDATNDLKMLSAMAEADGNYTSDEVVPLIDSIQELIDIYQRMSLHVENFESFIDENEVELKELGIDTFEKKKKSGEFNLYLASSIEEFEQFLVQCEALRE